MKRIVCILVLFIGLLFISAEWVAAADYTIQNFDSRIEINRDTSLTVTETISTYFFIPKHGIYRTVPVEYSGGQKEIKADLKVLSVTDANNIPYKFTTGRYGQSVRIKIGDADKTISGERTYVITYRIGKVLLRYAEHDEMYWNVTGSEWDTEIEKASAKVESPFAQISKVLCYAGSVGSKEENCSSDFSDTEASFTAKRGLGTGRDFTIVVGLNPANQLIFPSASEKLWDRLVDNLVYLIALLPLLVMAVTWLARGRDLTFISGNIYYKPEDKRTKNVSLFARRYLPLVYSPIKGLTPAQVGTIVDQKVDTKDLVAEIVELARLGFLKIEKIEVKGLLKNRTDYVFINKERDSSGLKEYQKYLLEHLFVGSDNKTVKLSALKNKFYQYLGEIKSLLYADLKEAKIFDGNIEKQRIIWPIIASALVGLATFLIFVVSSGSKENAFWLSIGLGVPTLMLAYAMPRRTAWGYSLYRQIEGLKYYLEKGKWREEIAEKHLFFEEILPLAISLGVVKQLAKDMAVLGVEPPKYFSSTGTAFAFADFASFADRAANNITSSPSGRGGWSGGSGFGGGGGSGGGFGGGGGGSW